MSESAKKHHLGVRMTIGIVGAVVALVTACVPPTPPTPQALAVTAAVADAPMVAASLSETPVTVDCPVGSRLLSGGIRLWKTAGGTPNNGLKVNGTLPSDSAGSASVDGSSNPTSWTAVGGFGGQNESGDQVRAFALCATTAVTGVTVEAATVADSTSVTATCPAGKRLVGGGARTTPAGNGSLKPIGSFPSDSAGNQSADGATNPDSWTAVGNRAPGDISAVTTTAFALCATGLVGAVTVERAEVQVNPWSSSTPVQQSASCPVDTVLVAGGARIDNGGSNPQHGLHLTGTFPSDATGTPADSGPAPTSWTAAAQSGGQAAQGYVRAFALCAAT